jgi:hypothetical protein
MVLGLKFSRIWELKRIALATNNPRKIIGLSGYGLVIADAFLFKLTIMKAILTILKPRKNS